MTTDEVRKMLDSHAAVPLWPEAGTALGLTRGHTYRVAAAGDIKVIPIGRLKKVPTAWLRKKLELDSEPGANAV
jgi:hypothetical protein